MDYCFSFRGVDASTLITPDVAKLRAEARGGGGGWWREGWVSGLFGFVRGGVVGCEFRHVVVGEVKMG